jgi:hypothetical protein
MAPPPPASTPAEATKATATELDDHPLQSSSSTSPATTFHNRLCSWWYSWDERSKACLLFILLLVAIGVIVGIIFIIGVICFLAVTPMD